MSSVEEEYVHKVYESIADHFSRTRYKPWPRVRQFLQQLPVGSLVLDVGCGNGKYLAINPDVFVVGTDRSLELLKICQQKSSETLLSDCLQMSFRPLFDAIICIAVLHHLSTEERRLRGIQRIMDQLVIGGKALIYVWALEQTKDGKNSNYLKKKELEEKDTEEEVVRVDEERILCVHKNGTQFRSQEVLVPWRKGEEGRDLRYYHVFRSGELEELVDQLSDCRKVDSFYDSGNHVTIIEKFK